MQITIKKASIEKLDEADLFSNFPIIISEFIAILMILMVYKSVFTQLESKWHPDDVIWTTFSTSNDNKDQNIINEFKELKSFRKK